MTAVLVDNDVLVKTASYGLLGHSLANLSAQFGDIGILAAAKFYVPSILSRSKLQQGPLGAIASFTAELVTLQALEPTTAEGNLAAEIELTARRYGLQLDVGESQLLAIAITRSSAALVTGDKRAICAISPIMIAIGDHALTGIVICLEQLVRRLLLAPLPNLNAAICGEPDVDKALSICFRCTSNNTSTPEEWLTGLDSYIADLRERAGAVLS